MTSSIQRMKEFKEFLIKRNPSKKFADKYATYLTSIDNAISSKEIGWLHQFESNTFYNWHYIYM